MSDQTPSILLVEDDQLDVMNVERELRKLQITVPLYKARNGREALDLLRAPGAPRPTVVLLDINMPRMNGLEFLRELRADAQLRELTVFVTTTSDEPTDREAMQQLGISGYITKPLSFERFGEGGTGVDGFSLFIELLKLK